MTDKKVLIAMDKSNITPKTVTQIRIHKMTMEFNLTADDPHGHRLTKL